MDLVTFRIKRVMGSPPPHPHADVVVDVVGVVVVAVGAARVPRIVVEGTAAQHPVAAVDLPLRRRGPPTALLL